MSIYDPSCRRCTLHAGAKSVCVGARTADHLISRPTPRRLALLVGEAPGATEDEQGLPFVGAAGAKLMGALQSAGASPEEWAVTNAVKCRPPKNRTPTSTEIARCRIYLKREIRAIQPIAVLSLGAVAARALGYDGAIGPRRGVLELYNDDVPCMFTWHPSYILRKPSEEERWIEDLRDFVSLVGVERGY